MLKNDEEMDFDGNIGLISSKSIRFQNGSKCLNSTNWKIQVLQLVPRHAFPSKFDFEKQVSKLINSELTF